MPDDPRFADRVEAALGLMAPPDAPPPQPADSMPVESETGGDLVTLPDGTAVSVAEVMEALRDRQALEGQRAMLASDREQLLALHEAITQDGDDDRLPALRRRSPDEWAVLAGEDPGRYLGDIAALDAGVRRRTAMQAIMAEQGRRRRQEHVVREDARLCEKLPDWKDAAKRRALQTEIAGFLKAEGYDDRQLQELIDHRTIMIVRKAMLWDRLQADAASGRAKQVPHAHTPTVRPVPAAEGGGRSRSQRLVEQARRSGRVDDRIAALEALLK